MADLDVSMAPGCFGISLLYRDGSNECKTCPFAAQCGPKAAAQLAMLRAELGIKVKPAAQEKGVPTVSPTYSGGAISNRLPVKVQELVDSIERAGVKVTEALSRGTNPFSPKFPFMRVACHLLLKRGVAGVKREEFCQAFMSMLHISKGTSDAYTLQAVRALQAIGATEDVNGMVRLRS